MWFKIIKQGKILTIPKTSMRIRKPEKVEEENTCNKKLQEYANKLKNMAHDKLNPWLQDKEYIKLKGKIDTQYKMTGWGLPKELTEFKNYDAFVSIEQTDYLYDEIPEAVACRLLDMIEESSHIMDNNIETLNDYNIGVINVTDIKTDIHRWSTEFSAYAIPVGKHLEPIDKYFLSDTFGGYDTYDKTVFLRHIIEVDYKLIDKGHTAVEVVWN